MKRLLLTLLGSLAASSIQAAVVTTFDEGALPTAVNLDVPNPGLAAIQLDNAGQELDFSTAGRTDMWFGRDNAPMAWTYRPTVLAGQTWSAETHVRYNSTTAGVARVAGLAFYQDTDGAGGRNDGMDFTYGLNDWNRRGLEVQGLASNAGDSGLGFINAGLGNIYSAFLRVEVTENGVSDLYRFLYKINQGDAWTELTSFNSDQDNSRVALFLKTSSATGDEQSVSFTYFNVVGPQVREVPVPAVWLLMLAGGLLLGAMRKQRAL